MQGIGHRGPGFHTSLLNICMFVCHYETVSEVVSELLALQPGLHDFELRAVVGRGRFAEVKVAREKTTGDVCALKVMDKTVLRSHENVRCIIFDQVQILSSQYKNMFSN